MGCLFGSNIIYIIQYRYTVLYSSSMLDRLFSLKVPMAMITTINYLLIIFHIGYTSIPEFFHCTGY